MQRSIFFVSDGTGITAETIGHSLLTQFEGIEFRQFRIPFVDTEQKAYDALEKIRHAAQHTQVWVISHANRLINALNQDEACQHLVLEKALGETVVYGQERLDRPPWNWPKS